MGSLLKTLVLLKLWNGLELAELHLLPLSVNLSSEGSYCWASPQPLSCTPRLLADLLESEYEHESNPNYK